MEKLDPIVAILGVDGGETANTQVAIESDGLVAGIVSGIASKSLRRAQLVDMQMLFRQFDRAQRETLQQTLSDMARLTQTIPTDGWYLTRISVASQHRGGGLADTLMDTFYAQSPDTQEYSLHVHKDNARAIAFYQRHGFSFLNADDTGSDGIVYRAMHRIQAAAKKSNRENKADE